MQVVCVWIDRAWHSILDLARSGDLEGALALYDQLYPPEDRAGAAYPQQWFVVGMLRAFSGYVCVCACMFVCVCVCVCGWLHVCDEAAERSTC
jgi:hypothetical protein